MIGAVSQNQTIKIAGAISVATTGAGSYTVPANSYAIVHIGGVGLNSADIGGLNLDVALASHNVPIYVGAGQTISIVANVNPAYIKGVLFSNSP